MRKIIITILAIFILSNFSNSQSILVLSNDSVLVGDIVQDMYNTKYYVRNNGKIIRQLDAIEVHYFVGHYKTKSKGIYMAKATRLYNTSTILYVGGSLVTYFGAKEANEGLLITGLCATLTGFAFKIAGDQQFKNVARLMEVELAADRVGIKVKF